MTEILCLFLCFFPLFLCNIKPKPTRPKRWRRVDGNACRPGASDTQQGARNLRGFGEKWREKKTHNISAHTQHTQACLNPVVHHLVLMPGLTFSRASWPGLNVTSCCHVIGWMKNAQVGAQQHPIKNPGRLRPTCGSSGISFTFFSSLFLYLPRRVFFFLSIFFIRVHISTYVIQQFNNNFLKIW